MSLTDIEFLEGLYEARNPLPEQAEKTKMLKHFMAPCPTGLITYWTTEPRAECTPAFGVSPPVSQVENAKVTKVGVRDG